MLGIIAVVIGVFGVLVAIFLPLAVERRKRPSFDFEVAKPSYLGEVEEMKYLHVKVINRPLRGRWLLRNTATGCIASLNYEEAPIPSYKKPVWERPARWSAKPEPRTMVLKDGAVTYPVDNTKLENCFHMDLEPSDEGEVIIVAIKHRDDSAAYGLSKASYEDPTAEERNMRTPSLRLRGNEYRLTVAVAAGGLKANADFTVYNGDGHDGFHIVKIPEPEHSAARAALPEYLKRCAARQIPRGEHRAAESGIARLARRRAAKRATRSGG